MNLLYNVCDVGINTAMGEGWGLVSCEHGATGAAGALESLYRDPARRQALGGAAIAFAHDPAHSWDVIAGEFDRLFLLPDDANGA